MKILKFKCNEKTGTLENSIVSKAKSGSNVLQGAVDHAAAFTPLLVISKIKVHQNGNGLNDGP